MKKPLPPSGKATPEMAAEDFVPSQPVVGGAPGAGTKLRSADTSPWGAVGLGVVVVALAAFFFLGKDANRPEQDPEQVALADEAVARNNTPITIPERVEVPLDPAPGLALVLLVGDDLGLRRFNLDDGTVTVLSSDPLVPLLAVDERRVVVAYGRKTTRLATLDIEDGSLIEFDTGTGRGQYLALLGTVVADDEEDAVWIATSARSSSIAWTRYQLIDGVPDETRWRRGEADAARRFGQHPDVWSEGDTIFEASDGDRVELGTGALATIGPEAVLTADCGNSACTNEWVRRWGKAPESLLLPPVPVTDGVILDPLGRQLVAIAATPAGPATRLIDLATATDVGPIESSSMAASADGRFHITTDPSANVVLLDLDTGERSVILPAGRLAGQPSLTLVRPG